MAKTTQRERDLRRNYDTMNDDKSNYLDKELEAEKRSKTYSTEIINKILNDLENGEKADMIPFFHGKTEWRNSDIAFEYTKDEWEELQKCALDPVYFVENYCTFLTDYGRRTVTLRPYQREIVHLQCDQYYNEQTDKMTPCTRRLVMLQARQTGKCFKINELAHICSSKALTILEENLLNYSPFRWTFRRIKECITRQFTKPSTCHQTFMKVPFYEIYYNAIQHVTFLDFITYHLCKHNRNGVFDSIIYKLMCRKFKSVTPSHKEKLIDSHTIDLTVQSDHGAVHASQFHITKPFKVYHLELTNGMCLDCADEHLVYASDLSDEYWCHVDQLNTSNFVKTTDGWIRVKSVTPTDDYQFMCDLTVDSNEHSYYTSDILSHNTTTSAASIVYYITFNVDRNVMVVANKGQTAEEVFGKIADVIKGLPFWLKPGVKSVSKTSIKFENGCSLRCSATSDTPATGDTLHLLLIDECALIPANKIVPFWQSVYPTMSSSDVSQIIVLSTPRGKHNLYYDLYSGAVNGTNGFVYKRVDYWEVPGHDTEEWKQEQIAVFGEANFNQEFGLSFESDASKLIGPNDLKFMNRIKKFYRNVDIFGIPPTVSSKIYWHPDFHPDQLTDDDLLNSRFLLQIDTAEGKQKGAKGQEDADWNIINIFKVEFLSPSRIKKNRMGYKKVTMKDCVRMRQIGIYMDQDFDEEHCADAAKHIVFTLFRNGTVSYSTNEEIDNCRIMIEINFNGANWLKQFKGNDLFYPSLILKTYHSQKATTKEMGFKTVGGNHGKGYFCESGARLINKRQIIVSQDHPTLPVCSTIQQCESFGKNTRNGTYEGASMHDDIAVTVLFVSIVFEVDEFFEWIEDYYRRLCENPNTDYDLRKKLAFVGQCLDMYSHQVTDDDYSQEDIMNLYKSAASNNQGYRPQGMMGGMNGANPMIGGGSISNPMVGGRQVQNPMIGRNQSNGLGFGGGFGAPMRR